MSIDLTRRELQIMELVVSGNFNKEIANGLGVSLNTIETHLRHIYIKLGARNRTEAVKLYLLLRDNHGNP